MNVTWRTGKPKYHKTVLIRALLARLRGERLVDIEKKYGISTSYVSKLFLCADNCCGSRWRLLPKRLRVRLIDAARSKLMAGVDRLDREYRLAVGE